MRALAPGKLILTGEYAVVHGRPAIVTAVDKYADTSVGSEMPGLVTLDLADLNYRETSMLRDLGQVRARLAKRYELFLAGELPVREIVEKPAELMQFALSLLLDAVRAHPSTGLLIRVRSDIPAGCGMGSSAATVLSLLRAVAAYLKAPLTHDHYYRLALEAEKLQHGRPSGVDPYVCLHGGLLRFQDGKAVPLPQRSIPLCLVHTGTPQSTTGECVEQVTRAFGQSGIWDEFAGIERDMEQALQAADLPRLGELVRANHQCLVRIGVVPERVRQFIGRIEACGGAAKVCGAGSVAGDGAGVVWVVGQTSPVDICREFGYSLVSVQGERHGTRTI